MAHIRSALIAGLIVAACGAGRSEQKPMRSPSTDYPHPPATAASDGEIMGADRQAPGDKLNRGMRVGPGGVEPAGRPGTGPETEEEWERECERLRRRGVDLPRRCEQTKQRR